MHLCDHLVIGPGLRPSTCADPASALVTMCSVIETTIKQVGMRLELPIWVVTRNTVWERYYPSRARRCDIRYPRVRARVPGC